jgi:hypothetical protein
MQGIACQGAWHLCECSVELELADRQNNIQFLASVSISGKQIISLQADHTPDHVLVLYENGELQRICVPIE